MPCQRPTGHKPSHCMVSALSPVLPHMNLVLAFDYHLYLSHLHLPCKQEKFFPPECRLSSFCLIVSPCSASYFCLTLCSCFTIYYHAIDKPAHQILSYTLLFSLFHYFRYIADPPLCTPADVTTCVCVCTHLCMTLAFASSDQPCLFDGHMMYNSHALFPFLVAQHAPSCGPTNHESSHCVVRHLL